MRCLFFTVPKCGTCNAIRRSQIDAVRSRGHPVEEVNCMERSGMAERYGIEKVPTTVVLDDSGEVYSRYVVNVTADILAADMEGGEAVG